MDPDEVLRLMRIIRDNGHTSAYLPTTRMELRARGIQGAAERALGAVPVAAYDPAQHAALACTVIVPGEVPTLPDNKTGLCAWRCGRTVQFRPWVPPGLETVCLYCLAERKKEDN
jgi:hypothetical protein